MKNGGLGGKHGLLCFLGVASVWGHYQSIPRPWKPPEQPRNTFKTFEIHGKKGDSENMGNTIYLAFLSVGEGNSALEYTIYIV